MHGRRLPILLGLFLFAALAVVAPRGVPDDPPAPVAAARAAAAHPAPAVQIPAPRRSARARLARHDVVVEDDPRTGGLRTLSGPLTGPQKGDPAALALRYVRKHKRAFGLASDDLDKLELEHRERKGRLTRLTWTQSLHGVPLADSMLKAIVDKDGRVISLGGGAQPLPDLDPTPAISAQRALELAGARAAVTAVEPTGERETRFADGAQAALLITNVTGEPRLAWHIVRPQGEAMLDQLIDARTGAELQRYDRVRSSVGIVYDAWPGAPKGGQPRPVDMSGWLEPGATTLTGPLAHVYADVNDNNIPDSGEEIPPQQGLWDYARTAFPGVGCPAVGCAWDRTKSRSWETNRNQAGTNLFALLHAYRDHLAADPIDFDGFHDEDQIQAQIDDGANDKNAGLPDDLHRNNAKMYTPKDGQAPFLQMYLWGDRRGLTPSMNGAEDASVVFHEYTHGFNNRAVVDATGWSRLYSRQSTALDEGVADFFALDLLAEHGAIVDTPAPNEVVVGQGADPAGILRTMHTDCAVKDLRCTGKQGIKGGYTYGMFGRVDTDALPEPHADGEIITQTLWDLRARLIADLGEATGLERMRRLIADGMKDVTIEPSYLDLRNAMLAADAAYLNADRRAIWEVFAKRGMGWFAATRDGDDDRPVENFDLPGDLAGTTLTGTVTDRATGQPLANALVQLGGHENKNRYGQDLSTRTDDAGHYTLTGVPAGEYPYVFAERNGYERATTEQVTVRPGGTELPLGLRRNWADARGGATLLEYTGDDNEEKGCGPQHAFDGDRMTGWFSTLDEEPSMTIALPADVTITSFGLDLTPRRTHDCRVDREQGLAGEVTIEVASEHGWFSDAVEQRVEAGFNHKQIELRPDAPLEDVRRVRLTLRGNHGAAAYNEVSMSELLVFASRKRAPRAAFTATPGAPDVDQEITLDATASRPGSADIANYQWDLDGDGTYERKGVEKIAKVTFDTAGLHRVGLKVIGADDESDETRRTLSVSAGAEIFDLGTVESNDAGDATARQISPGGVAVGASNDLPFRYRDGSMSTHPLGLPAGHKSGVAYQANDSGLVAGSTWPGIEGPQHAVIWDDEGNPTDLSAKASDWGEAIGVNSLGWVVGHTMDAKNRWAPFIKLGAGPVQNVEELAGVPDDKRYPAHLKKINELGTAVGCRGASNRDCHAALRYDAITQTLTELTAPFPTHGAADINDAGTITGAGWDMLGRQHALVWSPAGVAQELPGLGGSTNEATAINAAGDIAGTAADVAGFSHAVRWRGGAIEDLNAYVKGTGWRLEQADGINDRGEVVGEGTLNGVKRAFQLNLGPCRVCIDDVRFLEHDVPTKDGWSEAGADGIVDGNRLRVVVKVRNDDTATHAFQLRVRDEATNRQLDEAEGLAILGAGETKEIELDQVDTDGLAWLDGKPVGEHVLRVRATLGHTVFSSRGAVLKVRPRPLILIPGMFADASAWAGYEEIARRAHPDWEVLTVGDGRYPGALDTGSFASLTSLEEPKSLAANAAQLGLYVESVRRALGAEHVDLVAHSVGGLIARQWIHAGMAETAEATHLLMLGTPNLGTECAEEILHPAWMQYRRDSMARFNASVTERRGVIFSALAGTGVPRTCSDPAEGDGLVSVDSARWTVADWAELPVWHTLMPGSGMVFTSFVLPRLNGTLEIPTTLAAPADEPPLAPYSHQGLAERVAALDAGGDAELAFDVDGGSRLSVSLLAGADVGAELLDPAGAVVASVAAGEKAARGMFRTLSAPTPAEGRWRLRVRNTGGGPTGVAAAAALEDDPWRLDLRLGQPASGGGLPIVAAVANGAQRVKGARVTVALGAQSVELLDDGAHGDGVAGDGCYGAEPLVPDARGLPVMLRTSSGVRERLLRTLADVVTSAGVRVSCARMLGRNGEVAFDSAGAWATVRAAGGDAVELPGVPARVTDAQYSPDGSALAWTDRAGGVYVDGRTVVAPDGVKRGDVAWSPDGTQLAYSLRCSGPLSPSAKDCGIGIADVASGAEHELLSGGKPLQATQPTWSPDGTRIAFARVVYGAPCPGSCPLPADIHSIALDGSGLRRLTTAGHWASDPAWSPDGDRIAFVRFDFFSPEGVTENDREIYVVRADGTGLKRLTDDGECVVGSPCRADDTDTAPAWSPDGRRIAFVSDRGEPIGPHGLPVTQQVWEMRADGTSARRLTSTPTAKTSTTWRSLPYLQDAAVPDCRDLAVSTQQDTALRIVLDCQDDNGDVLALRVLDAPARGSLASPGGDGSVRYTPAAGYVGEDAFTYTASDGAAEAPPARVTITVAAPPPPAPTPTWQPPTTGGGGIRTTPPPPPVKKKPRTGGGGGGTTEFPNVCTWNVTGFCSIPMGCSGGRRDNCLAKITEVPAGRSARASAAKPKLVRTLRLTIPAGRQRTAKLRLTAKGRARLRRTGRVKARVRVEVRRAGELEQTITKTLVFRKPKKKGGS
jgi:hypothetical protein